MRALRSHVVSPSFQLIVFDLDGTLIDSRRDIADAANALLEDCGGDPLPEARIGRMVGDGAATLVARAFEFSGIERPPDALERFHALYDQRLLNHTRPYPGLAGILDLLGVRAKLAVLTNKPIAATRRILAGLDLARHFPEDAVIGGDGRFPRKPDPAGLRHLIDRAGVGAESALLVGDSVIDWRVARAASTPVCLARYGFGFERFPVQDIGPADRMIDAPADLLAL
jgi:phosphoglycolate phosphatase